MADERQPAVRPLSAEEREEIRVLHSCADEYDRCYQCNEHRPCPSQRWEATVRAVEAERAAARAVLVWFEWAAGGYCATCFGTRVTSHASDCALGRALGRPECQG